MKTIVVPLDKYAESLLDYDRAEPHQLFELQLESEDHLLLITRGYWKMVNSFMGVNIDDYEDESITNLKSLDKLIVYLQSMKLEKDSRLFQLNQSICDLFKLAIDRNTSVHFFF